MQVNTVRSKMSYLLGREPTLSEISDQTGIPVDEIAMIENATAMVESIHQPNSKDGFTLESVLSDTESEEQMIEKVILRQSVSQLPEREKMVIHLRFFHSLTQERVAKIMSVSQVQVSRIEKRAILRLRDLMQ